jgi:hypothetical protein
VRIHHQLTVLAIVFATQAHPCLAQPLLAPPTPSIANPGEVIRLPDGTPMCASVRLAFGLAAARARRDWVDLANREDPRGLGGMCRPSSLTIVDVLSVEREWEMTTGAILEVSVVRARNRGCAPYAVPADSARVPSRAYGDRLAQVVRAEVANRYGDSVTARFEWVRLHRDRNRGLTTLVRVGVDGTCERMDCLMLVLAEDDSVLRVVSAQSPAPYRAMATRDTTSGTLVLLWALPTESPYVNERFVERVWDDPMTQSERPILSMANVRQRWPNRLDVFSTVPFGSSVVIGPDRSVRRDPAGPPPPSCGAGAR